MAVINGTSGADTLSGTSGNDTINGLAGNDVINGGQGGTDLVDGGDGRDSLQFMTATSGVVVDFVAGTAGTTSFTSIEKVVTGDFNDRLTGNSEAQNLTARAGMDTLAGGGGIDTLWGGAGNDTFTFRETGTANADSIGDWTSGQDTLLLDGAVMTALGAGGDFTAGDARFWASSTGIAHDADDRIIFNTTTRQIFYDADGSGSGAAQLIAALQSGATLVATDITVEGGSSGGQAINGTPGNDSLIGTSGDDTINGFGGNDTIVGGAGRDSLTGGAGSDLYVFDVAPGNANADEMYGFDSWESDMIQLDAAVMPNLGPSGNFSEADARFYSAAGASGGHDADDRIIFDSTSGALYYDPDGSGAAAAQLIARSMPGPFGGTNGRPVFAYNIVVVNGGASGLALQGTSGDDYISGTAFDDTMNGFAGNDALVGEGGDDLIDGGDGNDSLDGEAGEDTLIGGAGNDRLFGFGNDTLLGGDGTDELWGGRFIDGGAGIDTLFMADGAMDLGAGTFGDTGTIANVENVAVWWDSPGANISGSASANALWGGRGQDTLAGAGGNDTLDGGIGNDVLHGGEGNDSVNGGHGNDTVTGGDGDDMLSGDEDADSMHGGSGADVFAGGDGADTLTGGAGADAVLLNVSPSSGADTVTDFTSGEDALRFDGNIFTRIGFSGSFSSADGRFHAAAGAVQGHDGDDRVVYDTSTGNLYYDADGSGSASAQLVAQLQGAATLHATDIAVDNGSVNTGGTSGDDSLVGGPANDSFDSSGGNDTLIGNSGDDTLIGGTGNDLLVGNLGADLMQGGEGDDTLDGVEGNGEDWWSVDDSADTLDGGAGNDVYYARADDLNLISDSGGIDTVFTWDDYTLGAGLENLEYLWPPESDGEGVGVSFTGNELDNYIAIEGLYINSSPELDGGGGNDTLVGSGNVTFRFSAGSGDYGHDVLYGGGTDTIDFADARSAIVADLGAGTMTGGGTAGSGSAELHGIDGFIGGAFDDHIVGGSTFYDGDTAPPVLSGGAGNDTLESGSARHLEGGEGNDRLISNDHDVLSGGAGADAFVFASAPVTPVDDWYPQPSIGDFTSGMDDIVLDGEFHAGIGQSGNFSAGDARFAANSSGTAQDASDRVVYNTSNGDLWYDADGNGADEAELITRLGSGTTLVATDIAVINGTAAPAGQTINGTSGADTLTDTSGNDTINGLAGNDTINGGNGGNDVVDGGDGRDSLQFTTATSAVVVDFVAGVAGTTSFTSIEKAVTGDFNDTLIGNAAAQNLTARAGADTLAGAGGVDTLWGGAGNDRFIFRETGTANADTVGDWTSGSDEIALDNAALTALGADGDFVAGDARFWASSTGLAHDANDRVIYNTSTRGLHYDADGNGSGAGQLIATVQAGATVVATDIVVI